MVALSNENDIYIDLDDTWYDKWTEFTLLWDGANSAIYYSINQTEYILIDDDTVIDYSAGDLTMDYIYLFDDGKLNGCNIDDFRIYEGNLTDAELMSEIWCTDS